MPYGVIYANPQRLCAGPYLELFARQRREGWDSLGLEADSGPGTRRWSSTKVIPGATTEIEL